MSPIPRSPRALLLSAIVVAASIAVAGPALAKAPKRYGIEGKFISYDAAKGTFRLLVLSRKAGGFGGSTVGSKAPKDVEERKERDFAVKPDGSVLSRTVIKSAKGTGLDNSGTRDGFERAVKAIPTDRALAFSIEKNADHARSPDAPEYRIKTVVIKLTEAEIQARLAELLQDE